MKDFNEYEIVFNGTQDALFLIEVCDDGQLRFIKNNLAHQTLTGFSLADIQGKTPVELAGESLGTTLTKNYQTCVDRRDIFKYEETLVLKTGKKTWLTTLTPIIENNHVTYIIGSAKDITAEKEAQEIMLDKSKQLEGFFDVTLGLLCIADLDGHFIKVNKSWERILGYPANKLEQKNFLDFVHPDDLHDTLDAVAQLEAGQEVIGFTNRYRDKEGNYRVLEWRSNLCEDLIYASANDVTENVLLKEKVEQEKDFLQLIIDSSPNLISAKDWNGDYTLANQALGKLLGKPKEEIIGHKDVDHSLNESEINTFLKDDREVMTTGKQKLILEASFTDSEGNVSWFQTIKVPLVDSGDKEQRQVLGIATDITQRKEIEAQLKEREHLYRELVEAQQDLVIRVDIENKYTFVNDAYCQTFGMSREELIGYSIAPLVHEDDIEKTFKARKDIEKPPYKSYIELREKTVDGWRWIAWEDYAIRNEAGQTIEIQGVGRDITELKEAQQRAEESNRFKSQFLAAMSHDIRTPMNSIIGFSDMLQEMNLTDEQKQYVHTISGSAEYLMFLLNQLLDLSKLESGKFELEYTTFELGDMMRSCLDFMMPQAKKKGLSLTVEKPLEERKYLRGDKNRIRQILINLIDNAIKYTEHGEVIISSELIEQDGKCETFRFSVTDTGIGISEDKLEFIFEGFTQIAVSSSTMHSGAGLGLSICKQLANKMNGDLQVSSTKGKGSTFDLTVDLESIDIDEVSSDRLQLEEEMVTLGAHVVAETDSKTNFRLLIAEDNEDNQQLIKAFLKNSGYSLIFANNGMEAINQFKEETFDVILMDMQMPIIDGYEAVQQIREVEREHHRAKHIPIIALTAYATTEDREKCLQAGCDDFLSKPLKKQTLMEVLSEYTTTII